MRRVKCTLALSRLPVYVDLDAAPLIVRGTVNETDREGRHLRTLECTLVYLAAYAQTGAGLVEYVDETPEELFAMAPMPERPSTALPNGVTISGEQLARLAREHAAVEGGPV